MTDTTGSSNDQSGAQQPSDPPTTSAAEYREGLSTLAEMVTEHLGGAE
ncbi:hypothetical protein P3T35_008039 [Kitasatospora sp. GP30]|nr:hypothetical protein [Kitasatospora sp. GP30]MDH6145977.1 hypothetical protein [Kitasatospora sp. GP30]